jgi:hypothetical protein
MGRTGAGGGGLQGAYHQLEYGVGRVPTPAIAYRDTGYSLPRCTLPYRDAGGTSLFTR